jgi:hypothetical protein
VGEQQTAVAELEAEGVLEGLRWAWRSARAQTLRSFDPATGHDQGWLGYNAFKVLGDRLAGLLLRPLRGRRSGALERPRRPAARRSHDG